MWHEIAFVFLQTTDILMKRFFLYLSGWNGRITRCVIGLLLLAAGFYGEIYPVNLVLFIAGLIVFSAGQGEKPGRQL
jgi:hypothetical protein